VISDPQQADTPSPPQPDVPAPGPNPVLPPASPPGLPGNEEPRGIPPTSPAEVPHPGEPLGVPPTTPQEGLCRNSGRRRKSSRCMVPPLCGEQVKLLGERQLLIASIFRLSFAHHVDHLDTAQDRTSAVHGLEPEHRPHPSLNGPMILLNPIVQVAALANPDLLQFAS
jgi:hypothetical protein